MRKVRLGLTLIGLMFVLWGCSQQHDHKGKTPLVEVAGNFLYQEDLQSALPLNLSADDSVLFSENYIRTWVEDVLLFDKAGENVRDDEKVKTLVENYRRSLVMHTYQEELVRQQLSEEITQVQLAEYYEQNKGLFVLEKPLVKGLFIKVPLQSPGWAEVRRLYKQRTSEAIEKLEKYSLRNAVTYDYFYDQWRPLEELEAMMPVKKGETVEARLKSGSDVELKDTAFHYFLHIEEYLGKSEPTPLDVAQEEIKEILINLKRVEFINRVKEDLYRQAQEKNGINYYYLNKDE